MVMIRVKFAFDTNIKTKVQYFDKYSNKYQNVNAATGTPVFDVDTDTWTELHYSAENDTLQLLFSPDTGYYFDSAHTPALWWNDINGTQQKRWATVAANGNSGTFAVKWADMNLAKSNQTAQVITLWVNAVERTEPLKEYTIKQTLTNCTSDAPATVADGDTLNITLTAKDGYLFNSVPLLSATSEDLDPIAKKFTVSEDKKTATLKYTPTKLSGVINISGAADGVTVYTGKYGAINAYLVTYDNLEEYASKRFVHYTGGSGGTGTSQYEIIDTGRFINRLHRVYCDVGETADANFVLAEYDFEIPVKTPVNDIITLDFGGVEIPEHNSNVTDYDSVIRLFLPFVGVTDISAYSGQTVSLIYKINIITGDGVALVYAAGVLIETYTCKPFSDVLYRAADYTQIGNENIQTGQYLYGLEPFITVQWYDDHTPEPANDSQRVTVKDCDGYCLFNNIHLPDVSDMTETEYNEIISILQNGVYITPN